ncbi:MAG: cation:proton antiporter, partial [Bacteroidales bacterium]|nr:cation:proton antiporter [Bacteroidales bacterium]
LTLNRLIPSSSTLMNRLDFVGNTLFIPVFLISVGMIVDLKIIFTGIWPFLYSLVLITVALAGKWIAAALTRLVFKLTGNEMNTIFGLTTARAAATLVVALVGLEYELISSDLFNAIILLIMATSLFSSYLTEKAGMKLAISQKDQKPDTERADTVRFLVPIANPGNIEKLIDLAILMKNPKSTEAINTLAIVKDDREAEKRINYFKPILDKLTSHAAASGIQLRGITRLDVNIPNAIVRASRELGVTDILLGWSHRTFDLKRFFGNLLEGVVNGTSNTVIVGHLPDSINTTDVIRISVAEHAEMEKGFRHWLNLVGNLSNELTAPIIFHAPAKTGSAVLSTLKKLPRFTNATLDNPVDFSLPQPAEKDYMQPLYILISARPHSISYDHKHWNFTYALPEPMTEKNLLIIYPQQFE